MEQSFNLTEAASCVACPLLFSLLPRHAAMLFAAPGEAPAPPLNFNEHNSRIYDEPQPESSISRFLFARFVSNPPGGNRNHSDFNGTGKLDK